MKAAFAAVDAVKAAFTAPDRQNGGSMNEAGSAIRAGTQNRRDALLREVLAGSGNIHELAGRFDVSASTIRRDLAELARAGHVVRTYGGALHSSSSAERTLQEKGLQHTAEKEAIAMAAAREVRDGEVVLLDAGTTTGRLARHLAGRRGLTVVTNGLTSLLYLAECPGIEVIVLGGRLRHPNEAIIGSAAEEQLRHVRPDRVFLGGDGLTAADGVCCPNLDQAHLKHAMSEAGRHTYVLVDHSKLGESPFRYWAPLDRRHTVIVDAGASSTALKPFRHNELSTVLIADVAAG